MTVENRQSAAFFEARYIEAADPWDFACSSYEQARYQSTLGALSRSHYRNVYEPGCSVGVLTAALAARCDRLIACDFAPSAVAVARERCREHPHVHIYERDAAEGPPSGCFDLIVFSEIGYYFSVAKLREMAAAMAEHLEAGGELVAVHWRGDSADHVLHGDVVHDVLASTLPCQWIAGSHEGEFRMDSWRRVS